MEKATAVNTCLGVLKGRDCIYLDQVKQDALKQSDLYGGHQWPSNLPVQGRKRLVSLYTHLPAGAGLFYL